MRQCTKRSGAFLDEAIRPLITIVALYVSDTSRRPRPRRVQTDFWPSLAEPYLAVPRPSPDMGQAEDVEGGPIRMRMLRTL